MRAKIITVGNLKGGVGKSTITTLFANYLYNIQKKNVLVIDADDFQQTIKNMRTYDLENHPKIKEEDLFHLLSCTSAEVSDVLEQIIEDYDYIFIDLPGNIKQDGVSNCYMMTDTFIIPTSLSKEDLDSTFIFAEFLNTDILPMRHKAHISSQVIGLITKVNKRTKEYKDFELERSSLPLTFFKEALVYSEIMKRKTNSIHQIKYVSKTFNIDLLYKELLQLLK